MEAVEAVEASDSSPGTLYTPETSRTWAEVDSAGLRRNIRALHRQCGSEGTLMAVVKADGYGHGAIPTAKICVSERVAHIAVATVAEANELRPLLPPEVDLYLLSPFLPGEAREIVRLDLIPLVSSLEQAEALREWGERQETQPRCFLMADTGMGREGACPEDIERIWRILGTGGLALTGIATHFASADEEDDRFTAEQIATLKALIQSLGEDRLRSLDDGRGNRGIWLSLSNSPALLKKETLPGLPSLGRGLLHRAGAILYGIEPYPGAFAAVPMLAPILRWKARVSLIKSLPEGTTVGYGRTHTLTRASRIATLAVGYADGWPRRLGNRGSVVIQGQHFPLIGRISMDQCQVDITDARPPITIGMAATLIGEEGEARQTVLDLALVLETTPHEPTCALSRRVPRLWSATRAGL